MGVVINRGVEGAEYMPPEPNEQVFEDVFPAEWYFDWTDALWKKGFTKGCSSVRTIFCPLDFHTMEEAAVYFVRMMEGVDSLPPEPEGMFSDARGRWSEEWIEYAYKQGIYPPCQNEPTRLACPGKLVGRDMAAYILILAKGISTE